MCLFPTDFFYVQLLAGNAFSSQGQRDTFGDTVKPGGVPWLWLPGMMAEQGEKPFPARSGSSVLSNKAFITLSTRHAFVLAQHSAAGG